MLRLSLVAIALIALLGPAKAADDGCEKFAWSLARERAAFAATGKTTIAAGETLAALPAGALGPPPPPGGPAPLEMPAGPKPGAGAWHWRLVQTPALAR